MIQKQHEGQRRAPQSDDLAFEVCQPEAQVSQSDGAPNGHEVPVIGADLHDGAHAALQRYLGQDVVQIAQQSWAQRRWTSLCAIMRTNSKTCCPPETKLGPSMWSMLKGLLGEAAGEVG